MANYDAIIVGAGAAGLMAAAIAAERGRRILLLEKNSKTGIKILMSGGTRCNLTQATDAAGIVQAFGRQGRFLHSALAALDPDGLVRMFHQAGVPTKVESTGKVFPRSDRALDVRDALLKQVNDSGAHLGLQEAVKSIVVSEGGFQIQTDKRRLLAGHVLITSGGQSYAGCGTTGDGYAWAKSMGHSIQPPRPALVPLKSSAGWVHRLSGITIPDVRIMLRCETAKINRRLAKESRRDSFLFTHQGVSGPAVLDVSRFYTGDCQGQNEVQLVCDFIPSLSDEILLERWRASGRESGRKQVMNELAQDLPRRLLEELFAAANVPLDRTFAELAKRESHALASQLKSAVIPVTGSLGFKKAEVTAGGVNLSEVHSKTLESKIQPGLFFAGEILDLDGPIGGFNFQAAFSTGFLAAQFL